MARLEDLQPTAAVRGILPDQLVTVVSVQPEAVGVRAAHREAHLAFLTELGGRLFLAGPLLSEDGATMVGSLIIVDCEDTAAARTLAARDPYAKAGLFSSVAIKPWRKTLPKS